MGVDSYSLLRWAWLNLQNKGSCFQMGVWIWRRNGTMTKQLQFSLFSSVFTCYVNIATYLGYLTVTAWNYLLCNNHWRLKALLKEFLMKASKSEDSGFALWTFWPPLLHDSCAVKHLTCKPCSCCRSSGYGCRTWTGRRARWWRRSQPVPPHLWCPGSPAGFQLWSVGESPI